MNKFNNRYSRVTKDSVFDSSRILSTDKIALVQELSIPLRGSLVAKDNQQTNTYDLWYADGKQWHRLTFSDGNMIVNKLTADTITAESQLQLGDYNLLIENQSNNIGIPLSVLTARPNHEWGFFHGWWLINSRQGGYVFIDATDPNDILLYINDASYETPIGNASCSNNGHIPITNIVPFGQFNSKFFTSRSMIGLVKNSVYYITDKQSWETYGYISSYVYTIMPVTSGNPDHLAFMNILTLEQMSRTTPPVSFMMQTQNIEFDNVETDPQFIFKQFSELCLSIPATRQFQFGTIADPSGVGAEQSKVVRSTLQKLLTNGYTRTSTITNILPSYPGGRPAPLKSITSSTQVIIDPDKSTWGGGNIKIGSNWYPVTGNINDPLTPVWEFSNFVAPDWDALNGQTIETIERTTNSLNTMYKLNYDTSTFAAYTPANGGIVKTGLPTKIELSSQLDLIGGDHVIISNLTEDYTILNNTHFVLPYDLTLRKEPPAWSKDPNSFSYSVLINTNSESLNISVVNVSKASQAVLTLNSPISNALAIELSTSNYTIRPIQFVGEWRLLNGVLNVISATTTTITVDVDTSPIVEMYNGEGYVPIPFISSVHNGQLSVIRKPIYSDIYYQDWAAAVKEIWHTQGSHTHTDISFWSDTRRPESRQLVMKEFEDFPDKVVHSEYLVTTNSKINEQTLSTCGYQNIINSIRSTQSGNLYNIDPRSTNNDWSITDWNYLDGSPNIVLDKHTVYARIDGPVNSNPDSSKFVYLGYPNNGSDVVFALSGPFSLATINYYETPNGGVDDIFTSVTNITTGLRTIITLNTSLPVDIAGNVALTNFTGDLSILNGIHILTAVSAVAPYNTFEINVNTTGLSGGLGVIYWTPWFLVFEQTGIDYESANTTVGIIKDSYTPNGKKLGWIRISEEYNKARFPIESIYNYNNPEPQQRRSIAEGLALSYAPMMDYLINEKNVTDIVIDNRYNAGGDINVPASIAAWFGDQRKYAQFYNYAAGRDYQTLIPGNGLDAAVLLDTLGFSNYYTNSVYVPVNTLKNKPYARWAESYLGSPKNLWFIHSRYAYSSGDMMLNAFMGDTTSIPNAKNIGDGITIKLVGDINGGFQGNLVQDLGSGWLQVDFDSNKYPNTIPHAVNLQWLSTASVEGGILGFKGTPVSNNQTMAWPIGWYDDRQTPDIVLDSNFEIYKYDVGLPDNPKETAPSWMFALDGTTTPDPLPTPVYGNPTTYRDSYLEVVLANL